MKPDVVLREHLACFWICTHRAAKYAFCCVLLTHVFFVNEASHTLTPEMLIRVYVTLLCSTTAGIALVTLCARDIQAEHVWNLCIDGLQRLTSSSTKSREKLVS